MKAFPAVIFGLVIAAAIGATMFVIGGNAILNPNSQPVTSSPAGSNAASSSDTPDQQQLGQMQQLINQYQSREQQYQQELQQAAQRLNAANQQVQQLNQSVQQYQQLLQALQDRGVIRISPDGRIFLGGGG